MRKGKQGAKRQPICEVGKIYKDFFHRMYFKTRGRKYYVKSYVAEAKAFHRLGMFIQHLPQGFAAIDFYLRWENEFVKQAGYTVGIFETKLNTILDILKQNPGLVARYGNQEPKPEPKSNITYYDKEYQSGHHFHHSSEMLRIIGKALEAKREKQ